MTDVTQVLNRMEAGDTAAASELLPLVYAELRRLASQKMRDEAADHTLQATALVHEAYLRLVDGVTAQRWENRGHFFAAAAEAMRRILIESARARKSLKNGANQPHFEIAVDDALVTAADADQLLDLDDALTRLADVEPELARLVELRFFIGLTIEQSAEILGVSPRTVKRNWSFARAWLGRELGAEKPR